MDSTTLSRDCRSLPAVLVAAHRMHSIGRSVSGSDWALQHGLMLDTGSGMRPVTVGRMAGVNDIFDLSLRAQGWRRGTAALPWRLAQAKPDPFQLLSVTVEAKVNE